VIAIPRAESQPVSAPMPQHESQPMMQRHGSQPEVAASQPVAPQGPHAPASVPVTRRMLAIGGGAVVLLAVVLAMATHCGGGGAADAPADAKLAIVAPPAPRPVAVVDDTIARATELIAAQRIDEALKVIASGRIVFPTDPTLPLMAGKLYFARLWFNDGLPAFRAAVRNDPKLAADPELIKTVLRGFITTPRYESDLADFLHDVVGPAAKSALAETAKGHPNATVRARAANELPASAFDKTLASPPIRRLSQLFFRRDLPRNSPRQFTVFGVAQTYPQAKTSAEIYSANRSGFTFNSPSIHRYST
jgi:hypothetical protein